MEKDRTRWTRIEEYGKEEKSMERREEYGN